MKIIVDSLGSDKGCKEIVKASRMAVDELGYEILIVGNEKEIQEEVKKSGISLNGIHIIDAPEAISMNDAPTEIMKSKSECSMAKGLKMLANEEGDAFVSEGWSCKYRGRGQQGRCS